MTVTRRLFLLVSAALLPAVAIQAYNELDLRRSRKAELREQALRQAQLAGSELSQILGGVRSLLTAVAEVPSVRGLDAPACGTYLADLQPRVPHLATIAVIGLQGRVVCAPGLAASEVRAGDRPVVREALDTGGFAVGTYTVGRISNQAVLPFALPLKSKDGSTVGVVATSLRLDWLNGHLRERALAQGGSLTIADRNGVILARDPQPERFVGTRIPDEFQELVHASEPGAIELTSQDGTRRVLGYLPSGVAPAENLYVSAGLSSEASFAAIDRASVRGVALILAGLLLALTAAWAVARHFILQPVAALRTAAARWQAGDYRTRSGLPGGRGEFGLLGAAFERMVEEIARRESELHVSEARLRAAIETLPFDFWICDQEGRYVLQNSASRRNWGDRVGLRPEDTDSPPEVVARWTARNRRALAGETLRGEASYVIHGQTRAVEYVLAPIESDGRVVGYVGVNIDITERKRAEERQRLLLRELSHRVKNTLAIVQVIANRSLTNERTLDEARAVLVERLRALAATHDLLTASGWEGASLKAIAEAELRPYGKRAELIGQDLLLSPRAAQTLGLILHELATNAAKHGALSVPDGQVRLCWSVAESPSGQRFHLEWRERGGPPVRPPPHRGFGRALIEQIVAHEHKGEARLCFPSEGVAYVLETPLAEVTA
jgi:PAS domain S-box-containing protein